MTYEEMLKIARTAMEGKCSACPVCNGRACKNRMPGPGAKGIGDTAIRNYDKWQEVRVNMDTMWENGPIDTTVTLFGHKFRLPVFAGPVGAVSSHYGDKHNDLSYNDMMWVSKPVVLTADIYYEP